MKALKTSKKNSEKVSNDTMTLIAKVSQPMANKLPKESKQTNKNESIEQYGTEFELTLENISTDINLSTCIGTIIQRLTDYMRLYKRNNSKLIDCRQDVFFSIYVVHEGNRVNWISEKMQQMFKFKYRASTSEKGAKMLASRVYDVVTFMNSPYQIVNHTEVK